VPTAILEQNSLPGITNRILGRIVRKVVIAFASSARFFPTKKLLPLGNPIRAAVIEEGRKPLEAAPGGSSPTRVLVLGGSQGAHAVNELLSAAVAHWAASDKAQLVAQLRLRHQTGTADSEAMTRRYGELALPEGTVQVDAFISDMGRAYAECDFVVGRAGATTLAELTAIGKPALLIPFPQAADDHQTENARSLVAAGAAELFPQATTTPSELAARLRALCDGETGRARLLSMAEASRRLGRPDAARDIAEHVLTLVEKAERA
jgi:UDP-N-acetylglucosamine--N-acetylmuramyl-(pentapeptide) pyrophosphoryl-undecaprenol N-acetylglucosamine transferase